MKIFRNLKRHSLFWPVKLFLKRLVGRELWLQKELELKTKILGEWEFYPDEFKANGIVYSLGVGDCLDFDLQLIESHNAVVFAFDPTPYSVEWVERQVIPENLNFLPWAVAGSDGELTMAQRENKRGRKSEIMWTEVSTNFESSEVIKVPAYTIATIMKKLQHKKIDLMKIDVEGSEYEIVEDMIRSQIKPQQLLIEFHHRFKNKSKIMTINAIKHLQENGYKIFSISETGREVGFIHTE